MPENPEKALCYVCYNCSKTAKMVKSGKNGGLIFILPTDFLYCTDGETNWIIKNIGDVWWYLFLLHGRDVLCQGEKFTFRWACETWSCVFWNDALCKTYGKCFKDCICYLSANCTPEWTKQGEVQGGCGDGDERIGHWWTQMNADIIIATNDTNRHEWIAYCACNIFFHAEIWSIRLFMLLLYFYSWPFLFCFFWSSVAGIIGSPHQ